ncbi:PsiF family protein [Candidatus Symbiobacter mobilis]|uniref:Phosphate starvation-inducible protein PsiF n=1 Tax=Candidatus Symbiobacter mobilis CR TaxID=946483 RepID=U5NCL4_9BURK|nr:PsiF family protein [Candidatus Symbiobacter mobilis]AGX87889.1 hypothetical protein Cenrod_1805 [Candidatus Symbiobacter mobilis CR]
MKSLLCIVGLGLTLWGTAHATEAAADAASAAEPAAATAKAKAPVSSAVQAQRNRMKACNQEARTQQLKGQPRRDFMKECLRKKD